MQKPTGRLSVVLDGSYANYFRVGHNAFEFVLDFGQCYPPGDDDRFHSRVITTPAYAKAFSETLRDSIARYEEVFGTIPEHSMDGG